MGDNETCVYHDDRCAEIKEIKENIKELFGKVNEQGGDKTNSADNDKHYKRLYTISN